MKSHFSARQLDKTLYATYRKYFTYGQKARVFLGRRPLRYFLIAFASISLWLLASYLVYRRFPNNYTAPNFYSEDGNIFAKNIIDLGFWQSVATTFNGYYIWGIYLLEQLGFMLNKLLYGGGFTDLPRSLALVSYGFIGFCAVLPALLLRRYIRPAALIITSLLVLYVPLVGWDYGILGTIGNLKFAFIYIAFVLLVYRNYAPDNSKGIYLADIGLLLCAYTNVTVYLMIPFALLRYIPHMKRSDLLTSTKQLLLNNRGLQSLILLVLALLPQLYVVARFGVPATPGYLDTPYQLHDTIEILGIRSYIYGLVFTFYKELTTVWSLVLLALTFGLVWRYSRQYRPIVLFGIVTIFLSTALFVSKRTGVSAIFEGYDNAGPDQFFYAQNMVFALVIGIVAAGILASWRKWWLRAAGYSVLSLLFFFVIVPGAGSYGKNKSMESSIGTIYDNAKRSCLQQAGQKNVSIPIYPSSVNIYTGGNYDKICTKQVLAYEPPRVDLGLQPYLNAYVDSLGQKHAVYQTFTSPRNGFDGLDIYFSTFGQDVKTPYQLQLLDGNCRTIIASIELKNSKINDNSFTLIGFPTQHQSAGRKYCFTIKSLSTSNYSPLAVQLSKPDVYLEGAASVDGETSIQDIVFALHYDD